MTVVWPSFSHFFFPLRRTLQLARLLKDKAVEAQACYSLGNTYTLLQDYERAIDYHLKHLVIAQDLNDRYTFLVVCCQLPCNFFGSVKSVHTLNVGGLWAIQLKWVQLCGVTTTPHYTVKKEHLKDLFCSP